LLNHHQASKHKELNYLSFFNLVSNHMMRLIIEGEQRKSIT